MSSGFTLKVDKDGLVMLEIKNLGRSGKAEKAPIVAVRFVHPRRDGSQFQRCLKALHTGDVVEVRFLPFLPKEC